mmetsp:Transcript_29146/g.73866  ORF Transcript_29146/g.73866 Transcript_29146/m.73866 type:complete len:271 (-) Transcript_29146:266-1078(-)
MEEYISLPCWSHISSDGRELMGKLLNKDPRKRPTVTAALKHPWLASYVGISAKAIEVGRSLPGAVRSHSQGMDLRRLSLAFAAREIDDGSCHHLREIFMALVVVCEGALTRSTLEKVVPYLQLDLRSVAEELIRNFAALDTDGSGSVDWTELLAAALGGSVLAADAGVQSSLPQLQEDACWRAFDVLSQGSGCISQKSLADLFQPNEDATRARRPSAGTGGSPGSGARGSRAGEFAICRTASWEDLNQLVREVDIRGVGRSSFISLLRGR